MAKIDANFPWDTFRFLPKSLRDGDNGTPEEPGVLERYMGGIQRIFEAAQADIQTLDTLHDIDAIEDRFLTYLKWNVGWTNELNYITDALTSAELRKLIRLSVAMWKLKGTEQGIKDSIRLLTGRDVIILNWFRFRWSIDITGLWRRHVETDPWLVGEDFGERDQYLSIILVMNELGIQKQLIRDVVELNRPLHENFLVVYADVVDDFRLGRGRWTRVSGPDAVWLEEEFRLRLPSNARQKLNVPVVSELDEMVYTQLTEFTQAGQSLRMDHHVDGTVDFYRVTFQQDGTVIWRVSLGSVLTVLGTATLPHELPVDDTVTLGFEVRKPCAGKRKLIAIVDAEPVLEVEVTEPYVLAPGDFHVHNNGAGPIFMDNVLLVSPPVHTDLIPGTGTLTPEPDPLPVAACVIFEEDFTPPNPWVFTSHWHVTQFRHLSPSRSLYFGTGESGYHTWGTAGAYAGGPHAGNATSPPTDLSDWDPLIYGVTLKWFQHLDISLLPGEDDISVEVRVGTTVIQTISKAAIVAAGSNPSFDISAAAGQTPVRIRFKFDTIVAHGSTGEGWYIDDVAIVITEL